MPPVPTRLRPTLDFVGAETDGVRLPTKPPIREVLPDEVPTLEVRPELTAGCLAPVGVEGLLVPIEPPIRPCGPGSEPVPVERELLPELERLLEGAAGCFATVETDGLSIRIELPMRDLEPGAGRSILIDRLPDEDTDGALVLIEPPIRDLELVIDRLGDEDTDGVLVLMEPPIRDRLLGLIPIPELLLTEVEPGELLRIDKPDEGLETEIDRLGDEDTDGVLVLMEPPIRDLELVIDRLGDEDTDGVLVLMEPPIRALLLGLIRSPELLLTEVEPVELLLIDEPDEGLETVIRLDVDPPGLLLVDIVPERLGIDRFIDILLELLLRLGTDRLDEIELDRLGVGIRLMDDRLELLRLGTDRLEVTELLRLGVDRLMDDRLELLRLGVDRLDEIELDRLGVDRLTDDLLELLRLGVLALAGGADLATDVFLLELLELELFLELLPAKTGSATRASSKIKRINRKSKPCPFD